jgi:serine O-acetyltransferase
MGVSELLRLIRADLQRLSKNSSGLRLWAKIIHPRFVPVLLIRLSQYFHHNRLLSPLSMLVSLANVVLFGLEVTPRCKIGPGLLIPHASGTVIGAIEIGRNVTIYQGVTFGAKFADLEFTPDSRPVVEDDVVVGAGAKVLGGIRIGRKAVIASNSLVTESVPEKGFAIGVPAIISVRE